VARYLAILESEEPFTPTRVLLPQGKNPHLYTRLQVIILKKIIFTIPFSGLTRYPIFVSFNPTTLTRLFLPKGGGGWRKALKNVNLILYFPSEIQTHSSVNILSALIES
jgi:hypothetical protein